MMAKKQIESEMNAAEDQSSEVPQISIVEALKLQISPGIASLVIFIAVAFVLRDTGTPLFFALAAGILFGEVPLSWIIMISRGRKEADGKLDWGVTFPWHRRLSFWTYLLIGLPMVFVSVAIMFGLMQFMSHSLHTALFGWVPEWLILPTGPGDMGSLSTEVKYALLATSFFVFAVIGGFTQEMLARGYILPRISRFGLLGAPVLNAMGFAMLHLIAPWDWPVFFIMTLLWSILVYYFRSVRIGIFIHVGMLLLQSIGMTLMVLGVAPPQ